MYLQKKRNILYQTKIVIYYENIYYNESSNPNVKLSINMKISILIVKDKKKVWLRTNLNVLIFGIGGSMFEWKLKIIYLGIINPIISATGQWKLWLFHSWRSECSHGTGARRQEGWSEVGQPGGDKKMVSSARIGQAKCLATLSEILVDQGSGLRDMSARVWKHGSKGQRGSSSESVTPTNPGQWTIIGHK